MPRNQVAAKYAQSLLQTALDGGIEPQISEQCQAVASAIAANRQLQLVLQSPVIKAYKKLSILTEIFGAGMHPQVKNFLQLLADKNRIELLEPIARQYAEMRNAHFGMVQVTLRVAAELTPEQLAALQQRLEAMLGKKVTFTTVIDPSVIGGFVAKVGDMMIDASLRHQLDILKKEFVNVSVTLN